MAIAEGIILGLLLILILCVIAGLLASNRVHEKGITYTLHCPDCKDEDIIERGVGYQCEQCGLKFSK